MSTRTPTTEEDASMPIAIIGIGGRFPGDATNPEKLWDMVSNGRHAMTEIPKSRFNIDAFYHPYAERQGSMNVRGGHFLKDDVSAFDAPFFAITPKEAHAMDPQQRMALEVSYESLENAGIRIEDIAGTSMGCYMASFTRDYSSLRAHDPEDLPLYEATGNGSTLISNRVSWYFDLRGPSLSLDTACSSSLVALHLACQSLRTGETETALVGGTNLILMPEMQLSMTALHFLSPDNKSQTFDHKANGYARGEGAAVVLIKPLHLALRDNNVIRGVIRGTGVNQDGHTPGITLPSAKAQEDLIRSVYKSAGLNFQDTTYFEAHGTGTAAGDPLEASAIGATLGAARPPGKPLIVGSIKTNVGHMEGVSGLGGLIKAIYALEKGQIPPNLWFEKANPKIPMEKWGIQVPTELLSWPTDGLRRASINSFGYGGTNAHCVVDDAYHYLVSRGLKGLHVTVGGGKTDGDVGYRHKRTNGHHDSNGAKVNGSVNGSSHRPSVGVATPSETDSEGSVETQSSPKVFMWSAHEQIGCDRVAASLLEYLQQKQVEETSDEAESQLERLAFTLSEKRSRLPWKSYVVASSVAELTTSLEKNYPKPVRSSQVPKLGFVFTGQGAQWFAMGRELLVYPVFRKSILEAGDYLSTLGCPWNLHDELLRTEKATQINEPSFSQPICTALQVALVDLLAEWDIKPSVVVGHSSGEISAAYAKGSITREAAWKIAYHRGRLSSGLQTRGAMLAVGLGETDVQSYLDRVTDGQLVVACINSPASVTLSGDIGAIDQIQMFLTDDRVFARRLTVKTAYHSPHMKTLVYDYLESLQGVTPKQGSGVAMFSSVTGQVVEDNDLGPAYWVFNMVKPVKFSQAVEAALAYRPNKRRTTQNATFVNLFVEIGPHAALKGPLNQILSAQEKGKLELPYASVLVRGENAVVTALDAAGKLAQHGYPVRLTDANRVTGVTVPLTDMPPFAWNRSHRYWYESPVSVAFRKREHPRHDLFGCLSPHSSKLEPSWTNYLRVSEMPWMEHHKVQSSILYPFAGMLVMAIEAAKQIADHTKEIEGYHLRDIAAGAAIVVPVEEPVETKLQFRPWRSGSRLPDSFWNEFTISCRNRQGDWQQHCSGLVSVNYRDTVNETFGNERTADADKYRKEYETMANAGLRAEDPRQVYAAMAELGLQWGPSFTNLTYIGSGDYEAHCALEIPDTKRYMPENFEFPHVIHPATLDGLIQMMIPALTPANAPLDKAKIPRFVESVYVSSKLDTAPGTKLYGYSSSVPYGFNESQSMVAVSDETWAEPLVIMKGCRNIALESVSDGSSHSTAKSLRKLGARPEWAVDMEHLNPTAAREWFGRTTDKIPDTEWDAIRDLELASFIICKRMLKMYTPKDAESFAPHLQQFYKFMQLQYSLATEGKLNCQTADLDWLKTTQEFDDAHLIKVSEATVDGKLMCKQGAVLDKIFSGELEPLQVLREDDLLTNYYRNGIGTEKWNPIIEDFIESFKHKKSMKILEVGAGTGGTTTVVLNALGDRSEASACLSQYTYTDISSGFFEPAEEDFKEWAAFLDFKVLNIEKDPVKQGITPGIYDLVIANNVLHATTSIDACLANCRTMLKPGGTLLLVELTGTMARVPLIFGTLSGLWNGVNDNRNWGPMLTEQGWQTRLQQQGFTGLDMVFRDHATVDYSVSLMISRALPLPVEDLPQDIVAIKPGKMDDADELLFTNIIHALRTQGCQVDIASLQETASRDLTSKACLSFIEVSEPFMDTISQADFEALKHLILTAKSTLWLTKGAAVDSEVPESNLLPGLSRTFRGEVPSIQLTLLDLDPSGATDPKGAEDSVLRILRSSTNSSKIERPDWEYALRGGKVYVSRLEPDKPINDMLESSAEQPLPEMLPYNQPGRALALAVRTPGMLDTFQFVDDQEYAKPLPDDFVEMSVKAVGMNFHDVMISMGQIADTDLGVECSGVVTRVGNAVEKYKPGDKVITFRLGCYRTFLRNPEDMYQKMPENISFEAAATIPCIWTTVYYSIYDHIGAEIYVTVSSEAKKQFLVDKYGMLEDHVFNSRDLSFADGIKRMTNGRGVDVVINSLAGEALRRTWLCVAPFGRFIEVGKRDIVGNTGLDMSPFMHNIVFAGVNMLSIYRSNIPLFARIISDVMRLLGEGVIRPIDPLTVMDYSQIEEAFRIMQTGKHIGKMVLKAGDDDLVPIVPQRIKPFYLRPDATYLLPGGLGGLGRSIASWMVDHGARYLAFTSRSGATKPAAKELVDNLVKRGVNVKAFACDISQKEAFAAALEKIKADFPPIAGVLTCAMQLQDSTFERMTIDDYVAAIRPKVQGTRNLHDMLPKDLDFFICLSSVGGIVGSRGQGNYNAGNTYQDALMHNRRAHGLKGTSINVGVVLGIGITAERGEILAYLKSGAMIGVREKELLATVQAAMADELPIQSVVGLSTGGLLKQNGHDEPYWFEDGRFAHLRIYDTQSFAVVNEDTTAELQAALAAATSLAEASELVCGALMRKLAKAMLIEIEDLDSSRPANAYGVDSLVAVEVRAWVFKDVKSDVSVFDILSNAPVSQLAENIAAKSQLVSASVRNVENTKDM
ncbi:Highly reducing polyketide synthase alt5 [Colletotrichum shisoi]|uniref:Highly reducing polyketide synthase alt5 n=1 Tax=Colletotrichum shisoi TaxID=2078593 RepID=A0A5Q4C404_9PEZI|nr:Highly reducing polyketide synthase alt5 [Colletotrichum shisoi]